MISVPYLKSASEDAAVLDLCVRKAEKRCASPKVKRFLPDVEICEQPGTPIGGLNLCSRGEEPRIFRPIVTQDTEYSATVAVIQQRFYDDQLRSPRRVSVGSEHGDSLRSDSPALSPNFMHMSPQITSNILRGKPARPFKAYPKDPLSLTRSSTDGLLGESDEAYAEFRKRMLEQVHAATGGYAGNKNMKRPVLSQSPPNQQPSSSMDPKDSAYWERRKKNNEAAKRSRDARRAKEDEIAIRAAFLEQENVKLKYEVAALRNETNRLRCMLYSN